MQSNINQFVYPKQYENEVKSSMDENAFFGKQK